MAVLILTVPEDQRAEMEAQQDTSNAPTEEDERERLYWEEYARKNPCVGCGYCCRKRPCGVAQMKGDMEDNGKGEYRCTKLQWDDLQGRYVCGYLLDPKTRHYATDLYIGVGCSSTLFNQDREIIPHPSTCGWGHLVE